MLNKKLIAKNMEETRLYQVLQSPECANGDDVFLADEMEAVIQSASHVGERL